MSLEKEINVLFRLALELERRQKKGEEATEKELDNLRSLLLVIDSIGESMVPEEKQKPTKKLMKEKKLTA
jgi:hypothetical protein